MLAIACVVALTARRLPGWLVLVPVAVVFGLNAGFGWEYRLDAARNVTFAPFDAQSVAWVDEAVPAGEEAATLAGGVPVETRDALRLTELFNGAIGPAYDLGAGYAPTLAADEVRLGSGGLVLAETGPVDARWVVAPRELRLAGSVVAEGTTERLRLWRVRPPLRVLDEGAAR